MNPFLVAVVLGLVEGITEFLPVSSTGHLIVAGHLLGFTGPNAATFEIFIQLGAILAILVIERRRFLALFTPGLPGRFAGARGCALLAASTAPALLAGFLLHALIKQHLFRPVPVTVALLLGGLVILLIEGRHRTPPSTIDLDSLVMKQALLIGLCQVVALWPGVSRSGATIVGGLLCGLDRRTAATYSFLVAVPTMGAATLYDLAASHGTLQTSDMAPFAVGFLVSFVSAWAAVRTFVAMLGKFTLRPFAWYRIAVAPCVYWLVR